MRVGREILGAFAQCVSVLCLYKWEDHKVMLWLHFKPFHNKPQGCVRFI